MKIVLVALLLLLAGCATPQDAVLRAFAKKGVSQGYPGMALVADAPHGRLRSAAAGFADAEHGVALKPDDGFHIGSINKTFTAITALRLVDEGKLSLDATLGSLLGSAVEHIPYSEKITVAQLLDHSSNIYPTNNDPDYLATLLGDRADPRRIWTPADMIALADGRRRPPAGQPGDGHTYSDTNYTLLGMIVAKVVDRPLKQYVKETILGPLKMTSTYFYSDVLTGAVTPAKRVSQGYLFATKDIRDAITINPMYRPVPQLKSDLGTVFNTTLASERNDAAGGLVSTLPDMMKFADAVFRGRLLSPRSQAFLVQALEGMDQVEIGKHRTRALQAMRKSYGVVLYKEGDGPGGTTTLMAYLPAQDRILAGFTNSFGYFNEVDFMLDDVLAALAGEGASPKP